MSYVFQFFCGPQAAQQGSVAVKKAGAMARAKATMVPPPRPRPLSAPPARPPRFLRDREEERGYNTPVVELPGRSRGPTVDMRSLRERAGLSIRSRTAPRGPLACGQHSRGHALPCAFFGLSRSWSKILAQDIVSQRGRERPVTPPKAARQRSPTPSSRKASY